MAVMNRAELKKLWSRSRTDPKFRRLLLALLAALVCVKSTTKERLAACELAHFTLLKAGGSGRCDLRRILKAAGWEF